MAGIFLVIVLFLMPLPTDRRIQALGDLAHAPLFGAFALVCLRALERRTPWSGRTRALAAWTAAVIAGAAVEVAQAGVGRRASVRDAAADALGAAAALAWVSAARSPSASPRRALTAAGAVAFLAASAVPLVNLADTFLQSRELPRLASFEHRLEMTRWTFYESTGARVRERPTHGAWSLRVALQAGAFPGATLAAPPPDWSPWGVLRFDVELDPGEPVALTVRVEDTWHRPEVADVFERVVVVPAGAQDICVPLADVVRGPRARPLDLRHVDHLEVYAADLARPRTLHLDDVRLTDEVACGAPPAPGLAAHGPP
jgi:VanZ family protein